MTDAEKRYLDGDRELIRPLNKKIELIKGQWQWLYRLGLTKEGWAELDACDFGAEKGNASHMPKAFAVRRASLRDFSTVVPHRHQIKFDRTELDEPKKKPLEVERHFVVNPIRKPTNRSDS